MISFFVLGGLSPFDVLEGELVAGDAEVVGCILGEGFELDAEDAGLSCWFLSFSRRCFKYNVLSILDSDLWCPVAVDSTCSTPGYGINDASRTGIDATHQPSIRLSSA